MKTRMKGWLSGMVLCAAAMACAENQHPVGPSNTDSSRSDAVHSSGSGASGGGGTMGGSGRGGEHHSVKH